MIARHSSDGTRTFVNESYCRFHGKTKEELIGRSAYEGMKPEDLEPLEKLYETRSPENPVGLFDIEATGPGGETVWQVWTKRAVFDDTGRIIEFRSVGRDVSERVKADKAVRAALVEAERANQAKSEFLATMSHEFRTPLNAILGFSEMLRSQYFGPLGSDSYAAYANDIHDSGEHMLALVNDVLDIAAIEAGKRHFEKEAIDLAEVLRKCHRNFEKAAHDNGIDLYLKLPELSQSLYADKRAITQIVQNLLSNAIKLTGREGELEMATEFVNGQTTIMVRDTGAGIEAGKLERVTEPFAQTHEDPHRSQDGTGLGLAIVKSLVEAHDGELRIKSTVDVGTTVFVTLPTQPHETLDQ